MGGSTGIKGSHKIIQNMDIFNGYINESIGVNYSFKGKKIPVSR